MAERIALVVDDSKSARFALRKYLEGHAFRVDTADSARAAYAWLQDQRPDLIFLDHVMPGEDGFSALQRIKDDPQTADIPVVICSSNEGGAFVAEARHRGAADVLQKPPSPEQLLRVLQQIESQPSATQIELAGASKPAATAEPELRAGPAATPPAGDSDQLSELRESLELLRADLTTVSEDGSQITQALEARASAIEIRLGAIEQRLAGDLANTRKHLDKEIESLRRHGDQAIDALRAKHEAALEALRDEQRQAIDILMQERVKEQDAQRRQFDTELRAIHEQFRDELARAAQTAREQALQDFRTRLLSALGE